ncbi:capsular polysaccharide export protein, LipB/KpsS family [Klebsiella aerogenes]|uniref:capsular polysaccharide export protein, LipB/KpsS family n=1 Tax=Klebsiella aerogenes TaxID=548 RepID=UPI000F7F9C7F|nr:methyltransferase domain-containing protein [Klebsiella aerogenes]RSV83364.1 methyltransferase domain-containing protein [Klebsiella aerogenes]HBT3176109.1 methyltransferase domain-containing protein [Klebsiella aerogenes]HBT3201429.1 methyltransferase domain-containing protein [Klebsiella aerogenes]
MATERLYFSSDESLDIKQNAYDAENIERHESRYYFAAKQLTADMSVLDCACGSGYGSDILKDFCHDVTGVDIDQSAVDFAISKYKSDKLKYVCGDIREIADSLDKVDTVVCLETLEHVPEPQILLDGFMKVLKDDGQFVVSTPVREASRENPLNSYHVLEYTSADLRRVLNHYFYQVDVYLQDQDKFYRIDDEIFWGFVVAVCKYPKNRTIEDLSLLIKDKETKVMNKTKETSFISESASVAESVLFKPSFEEGVYSIMDGVEIRENTVIESHDGGKLYVGEKTVIGYNCWLNATGGIRIGANTLIGANTIITSSSHHFKDQIPVVEQGMSFKPVTIGSNVWIGSNVSILEGVNIGDGCVIGANSVIKNDVLPNSIVKPVDAIVTQSITRNSVVFYLLPFTIRNDALTFQCIYDRYKKLAESFVDQNWDVAFIATNELKDVICADGWKCLSPSDYSLSYDENEWFERWKRVLNGQEDSLHSAFIEKSLTDLTPQMVFCWNYDGLLKSFCRENNITAFFNELGLSRAPNPVVYYSDKEGVNSTSALKNFWNEFDNFELSENERTMARLTLGKVRSNYRISAERKDEIRAQLGLADKKTILIALQVEDDSNIVAGSKFESMQQFVDECLSYSRDDLQFIIKKHPAQGQCTINAGNIPVIVDQYSTPELIALTDAVFTINSSLGFEALVAGKKVFTFGNAPYAVAELIVDVKAGIPAEELNELAGYNADDATLLKFVYLTYQQYFISESKFFNAEFHIRRLLLSKSTDVGSTAYFFDSGSYFKDREIQVNRFQNKVLQDAILGYEKWIETLKITEKNAMEISEWAQSLNLKIQEYENKKRLAPVTKMVTAVSTKLMQETKKQNALKRLFGFLKGNRG